jgi:hypothetical protein
VASFTIKLANLAESGPIVDVNVIPTGLYTQVFDPHRKTPPKPVGITAMSIRELPVALSKLEYPAVLV